MVREVVFVDEGRFDSYFAQLAGRQSSDQFKVTAKMPFGSGVEWSTTTHGELPRSARIDDLLSLLRDAGELTGIRPPPLPPTRDEAWIGLVHETVTATRVLLHLSEHMAGAPRALTVWIADPEIRDEFLSPRNHNFYPIFDVSFLYLVQEHWPSASAERFMSGCSALQYVANIATRRAGGDIGDDEWPPVDLGRENPAHPVEKLAQIGGIVLGSRRIETLYRVRYISNEQSYTHLREAQLPDAELDWTWLRVHDVAAYPVFIAAID